MATFQYIARSTAGEKKQGFVEATTEAAAARSLDDMGLFPIRLTEQEDAVQKSGFGSGIKNRDVAMLFEQLADLLRAGVPMLRTIQTVARTNSNPRMKAMLTQIADNVAEGKSLSDAMGEMPDVFNGLQLAMIRAGERGGFLEDVLNDLAAYIERADDLRNQVRGAMIYPMVLIMLGTVVISVCLVWLVPKFQPMFEGKEMNLPLPSIILFTASDLLVNQLPMTLAALALIGIGFATLFTTESGKAALMKLVLRLPVLGSTITMVALTRFCRILGTMLGSGVPIIQALQISKDAAGTPALAAAIEDAIDSVREGQGLTQPLRRSAVMPEQILEMMAVAEESNQLEKVLLKVADTVERRTSAQVDGAVRLVEPLILMCLAGAIGFVAMGILYPIFTLAQTLR